MNVHSFLDQSKGSVEQTCRLIDLLVDADRQLAQVAIYEAIAGGGDPVRIQKALDKMAKLSGYYTEEHPQLSRYRTRTGLNRQ